MRVKNILQYLEDTARRFPEKVSFTDGEDGESLTFGALLGRARRIGTALCAAGECGGRVGVCMERSPGAIAAMLGAVYAGACYVPLDAAAPSGRLCRILERAQVRHVICDAACAGAIEGLPGVSVLDVGELCATRADGAVLATVRAEQIDTDPLYIVFTSGSSGEPKGVIACHRSVIDYGEALLAALGLDDSCVFGCQSPLWFDAPLKEILAVLMRGATCCLIPRRCFSFPHLLLDYLEKNHVNTVAWVSSAFSLVAMTGALEERPPRTLRTVIFGSEVFPRVYFDRWRTALPEADFYQLYGPTEATGMSCVYPVPRELSPAVRVIPIGHALDNTQVLLIGGDGERILPVPGEESAEGEIYLRGTCVTLGYVGDAGETARSFVQNPLQSAYPEIVYRTGDLACFDTAGELVFRDRRDGQIKLCGHRIDPSEPEAAAMEISGVTEAAYVTAKGQATLLFAGEASEAQVAEGLRARLPRYMLPRRVLRTGAFPRKENGKLDRARLGKWAERGVQEE